MADKKTAKKADISVEATAKELAKADEAKKPAAAKKPEAKKAEAKAAGTASVKKEAMQLAEAVDQRSKTGRWGLEEIHELQSKFSMLYDAADPETSEMITDKLNQLGLLESALEGVQLKIAGME